MNGKALTIILLLTGFVMSSCHMSMPHQDITIINDTQDTLYYHIDAYNSVSDSIYNIAYVEITDLKTNKTRYEIDNIGEIVPSLSVHPSRMNNTWKQFAFENNGITILFYKKDIEKLKPKSTIPKKYIFHRFDLTTKQLDSCKYIVTLRN